MPDFPNPVAPPIRALREVLGFKRLDGEEEEGPGVADVVAAAARAASNVKANMDAGTLMDLGSVA